MNIELTSLFLFFFQIVPNKYKSKVLSFSLVLNLLHKYPEDQYSGIEKLIPGFNPGQKQAGIPGLKTLIT